MNRLFPVNVHSLALRACICATSKGVAGVALGRYRVDPSGLRHPLDEIFISPPSSRLGQNFSNHVDIQLRKWNANAVPVHRILCRFGQLFANRPVILGSTPDPALPIHRRFAKLHQINLRWMRGRLVRNSTNRFFQSATRCFQVGPVLRGNIDVDAADSVTAVVFDQRAKI